MRLYQPSNSLSADDYDILLREAIGKRRILEFGPGHSTYAWIEAQSRHYEEAG